MGNPRRTGSVPGPARRDFYTAEQRRRRDASRWTLVQGVLAPAQFVVFLISLYLVIAFLHSGEGYVAATISVIVKTVILYAIMITGSLWEKDVFDRYLFAPAFFWEDVVSMLVMALHTLYVAAVLLKIGDPMTQMVIALIAYVFYVINAAQYVIKFRMVRSAPAPTPAGTSA